MGSPTLVTLVDVPDVDERVVARVLGAATGPPAGALVRAAYRTLPGHPVLIGRDHWPGVAELARGDRGRGTTSPLTRTSSSSAATWRPAATWTGRRTCAERRRTGRAFPADRFVGDAVVMDPRTTFPSAGELAERLGETGYLVDDALATVAWLALRLGRPLLMEGEPGTGKTALAEALAEATDLPLIRLQCYEGIDATQALYDWDFPRQILHVRALEAVEGGAGSVEEVEETLFDERFLLARPVLRALRESPVVLLVDEIDRADDEFEAFLLEVLSTWQVTIPELGTVAAATPPIVVLTSNRTRELHDALKRRCLYHWIDHPGIERELAIVRQRAPEVSAALAEQVVRAVHAIRSDREVLKAPGVAETLDWARALHELGTRDLDTEVAAATLGVAVKYREDAERVRAALDKVLGR